MEQPIRHVEAPEETPEKTLGRRELLKALAAAGGAVTASSLLPGEWAKPVVEVGVLPAHAQVSERRISDIITTCSASNADLELIDIYPFSTITTYADISSGRDGVEIRRIIRRNDTGVIVDNTIGVTGNTGIHGRFQGPDFDLSTMAGGPIAAGETMDVIWTFVDPNDGTGNCARNFEIAAD
jgi:hypothetical protein